MKDEYFYDSISYELKENAIGRVLAKQLLKNVQGRALTILEASFPDNSRQLQAITELLKQEFNQTLEEIDRLCRTTPYRDETHAVILSSNGISTSQVTYSTIVSNHNKKNSN